MSPRPLVPLSIAGSDPTGGAGLQMDLKVFLRFGLSGAAVPTAITVQSTGAVAAVEALPARLVEAQLATLLADVKPAAVKIGLLPTAEVVRVVARALGPLARRGIPIVLDPVLAASDGTRFLPAADVPLLRRHLLPLATLITPNLAEAAELAAVEAPRGRRGGKRRAERAAAEPDVEALVLRLQQLGARHVLVKGGHGAGPEAVDVLGLPSELVSFTLPRVERRRRVHGTGCALSAAITALLARGVALDEAVGRAKSYVHRAIAGARVVGRGGRLLDVLVAPE